MKRLFTAVACAAFLTCVAATGALAGEVKGPPQAPCGGAGQPVCTPSTNDTAAPTHARSLCSFSGLNDMGNGQTTRSVQTPPDGGYPGAAAHGWQLPDGTTLYCNPTIGDNGVVPPPSS
jgi:hypothetical protein